LFDFHPKGKPQGVQSAGIFVLFSLAIEQSKSGKRSGSFWQHKRMANEASNAD